MGTRKSQRNSKKAKPSTAATANGRRSERNKGDVKSYSENALDDSQSSEMMSMESDFESGYTVSESSIGSGTASSRIKRNSARRPIKASENRRAVIDDDGDEEDEIGKDVDPDSVDTRDEEDEEVVEDDEDDEDDEEEDDEEEGFTEPDEDETDMTDGYDSTGTETSATKKILSYKSKRGKAVKSKKSKRSEEDLWLEALEAGELDEKGGLKTEAGPMTSRQRKLAGMAAVFADDELKELSADGRSRKQSQKADEEDEEEEVALKRSERARRRKIMADKMIEDEKIQTVEKLLRKKTSSKLLKDEEKANKIYKELEEPGIRYLNNRKGYFIAYGDQATPEIPPYLKAKSANEAYLASQKRSKVGFELVSSPSAQKCSVNGCDEARAYSKNGLVLCSSMACYQKVVQSTSSPTRGSKASAKRQRTTK